MNDKLKILILEDFPADAKLSIMQLKKEKVNFISKIVDNKQDFTEAVLSYQPDLILSDFSLPQYNGLEALNFIKTSNLAIPFIIVTGSLDEETAADCIKQGAWDYVIKEHLVRLGPAVKNAILRKQEIMAKQVAEKAKLASERKFEEFARMLPEVVCELDLQGKLTYVNEKSFSIFGYSKDEFKAGISVFDIIIKEDRQRARDDIARMLSKGPSGSKEYILQRKDRSSFHSIVHVNLIFDNSIPVGMRAIMLDISKQKRNEELIQQNAQQLKLMIESSPIGVSTTNLQGNFQTVNKAYCKMLGYNRDEMIGKHFEDFTHPDNVAENNRLNSKLLTGDISYFDLEKKYIRKDKREIISRIRSQIVRDTKGKPLFELAVAEDITDQKLALEEIKRREEFNYAVFQHNPIETIVVDKLGRIINTNMAVTQNRKRMPKIGSIMYKDFASEHEASLYELMMESMRSGVPKNIPESIYNDTIWSIKIAPFEQGAIITAIDITLQKTAEQNLLKSLHEKEFLLKEVHHRVKNNLQITSSMLKMQARHTKNDVASSLLKESHHRVHSMAMIHENLYQTSDFEELDFKLYLNSLIKFLFSAYFIDKNRITVNLKINNFYLNINQAIPCGLIMNEILSNAIKHAFPDNKKGKIDLMINVSKNENVKIQVKDNGIGFDGEIDFDNTKNLGVQLVSALANQLKGQVSLKSDKGVKFTLEFEREYISGESDSKSFNYVELG